MFREHVTEYGQPSKYTKPMIEALDLICNKLGRIANGDPTYDDSWRDIAGYAQLVVNELEVDNG